MNKTIQRGAITVSPELADVARRVYEHSRMGISEEILHEVMAKFAGTNILQPSMGTRGSTSYNWDYDQHHSGTCRIDVRIRWVKIHELIQRRDVLIEDVVAVTA